MSPLFEPDLRLLTCILPRGGGLAVLQDLHDRGIHRVSLHAARAFVGSGDGGVFGRVEKDILTVVAPSEQAPELFDWIYQRTRMGEVPGGFLFMAKLACASPFLLPEGLPAETPRA